MKLCSLTFVSFRQFRSGARDVPLVSLARAFSTVSSSVSFAPITDIPAAEFASLSTRCLSSSSSSSSADASPPTLPAIVLADISSSRKTTAAFLLSTVRTAIAKSAEATAMLRTRHMHVIAFSATTPLLQHDSWADGWRQHLRYVQEQGTVSAPGVSPLPLRLSTPDIKSPLREDGRPESKVHQQRRLAERRRALFGDADPQLGILPSPLFLLSPPAASSNSVSLQTDATNGEFTTVTFFRVDDFIPVRKQIEAAAQHLLQQHRNRGEWHSLSIVTPDHQTDHYQAVLKALSAERWREHSGQKKREPIAVPCLLFNSSRLVEKHYL